MSKDFASFWLGNKDEADQPRPNRAQRRALEQEDRRRTRRATRAYQRGQAAREEKTP